MEKSKYSNDFKLKVVKYCIEQYRGYRDTARYFNIPSSTTVKKWVKKYTEHGEKGLEKNKKASYSGEFKQNVIEYMNNNHLSFQETAIHFNISGAEVISKWESIYKKKGPLVLYKEQRGKSKNMNSKPRKKRLSKENEDDLIAENERLRMENAYLKKLQALVQKRTKPKHLKK